MILPKHALLELTYNCNHACPFCSCEWLVHPELYRKEMELPEWKELIRIYAAHGVTEFTFTGGEPLLKHGIGELIDFAGTLPQELKLNIFTNGTLLNDEILSTLKRNNVFLSTSIHSVRNQPYFTGASTTFSQTLDKVAKALKYGLKTSVSMTVTAKNFKEIANLGVAVLLAGADVFQIGAVMAAGRCLYHPELMLSPEQLKKLPILAGRLQKRFPNKKVYCTIEPGCKCSCYREDDGKIFLTYNDQCSAMKDYFTVGPSGYVRPCLHLPKDLFYWNEFTQNKEPKRYFADDDVIKNYNDVSKWGHIAAEQNDATAQYNVGVSFEKGCGVVQDYAQAVWYYRQAAEQEFAKAQFNLGRCYANGGGVTKDIPEAVKWFRKAADQGLVEAQLHLAWCYANGDGVTRDMLEAVKWFRKVADQGNVEIQLHLGKCYANGEGVTKDIPEAVKWFRKAAEKGSVSAKIALERLEKRS